MNIMLATICLNEAEWLPKLFEQHRNWPGLVRWVFVEGADRVYAKVNPALVSVDTGNGGGGLSVDGTTDLLHDLEAANPGMVTHIRHGFAGHDRPDQGKCELRNRYWDIADEIKPDLVLVLDSDEFYTFDDQARIQRIVGRALTSTNGFVGFSFRQRHIWRPASTEAWPLFHAEVIGGYWSMHHYRAWRWREGMRHRDNHNMPEGVPLSKTHRYDVSPHNPQCIHLGFASSARARAAKHVYYEARGEGKGDGRDTYVACREAWETWRPGDTLPHGAVVVPYYSDVPECLQNHLLILPENL